MSLVQTVQQIAEEIHQTRNGIWLAAGLLALNAAFSAAILVSGLVRKDH